MKKLASLFLTLAILVSTVFVFEVPASAGLVVGYGHMDNLLTVQNVKYLDENGVEQICPEAKVLSGKFDYADYIDVPGGWYVVDEHGGARFNSMTIKGDVHIIIEDDAALYADGYKESHLFDDIGHAGIKVSDPGVSLTIYATSTGDNMGKVIAWGGDGAAGIGGDEHGEGHNITINGGNVSAYCGKNKEGESGAGIGGGENGAGYSITINGGIVNATGGAYAAGIGGGDNASGHDITINGGTVNATGGKGTTSQDGAAAIGGGADGAGYTVIINGGTVTATGGTDGAGIGGGEEAEGYDIHINGGTVTATGGNSPDKHGGAGIGGGDKADGHDIHINNGTVTATGANNGAGIGGGNEGNARCITIAGGTTEANGVNGGAGIGGGNFGYLDTIVITGGTVTAKTIDGNGSAGIGGGDGGEGNNITISGGAVYAYSGYEAAGIGGGRGGYFKNINISNAYVLARGSEIGGIGVGYGADKTSSDCIGGVYIEQGAPIYGDNALRGRGQGETVNVNDYTVVGTIEIQPAPVASVMNASGTIIADCPSLQEAYEQAGTNTIILYRDAAVSQLTVAAGRTVTINLNGHTITGDGTGSTIVNNGTLSIYDDTAQGGVTGGSAENGGNIYNTGTLTMDNITISNGTAANSGGNAYNSGTMNLSRSAGSPTAQL